MRNLLAAFALTLTLVTPSLLFAAQLNDQATAQRSTEQTSVCRMTSTDMNFLASDANFSDARRSFNAHLDRLMAASPGNRLKSAGAFRVSESAQYFNVSVDIFACDPPPARRPIRSSKADSSRYAVPARSPVDGGSTKSCDFVGCVEGFPGGSAPNGSVMTLTTCETSIRTTIVYTKINGQWVVTSYSSELVVECGPVT